MAEIFTTIYESFAQSMGWEWIAWTILLIGFFTLIAVILELDFLLTFMVTALPVLVFSMYNAITLGAWGIAVVVLVLGLILALSIYRLVFK